MGITKKLISLILSTFFLCSFISSVFSYEQCGRWSLHGKNALVTGGTKGIGLAIVEEFLELGAKVLFCARNPNDVKEKEHYFNNLGYNVHGIVADLSSDEGE